jgi:hypothetical protein
MGRAFKRLYQLCIVSDRLGYPNTIAVTPALTIEALFELIFDSECRKRVKAPKNYDMKPTLYFLLVLLLGSCTTLTKSTRYLNRHSLEAAEYCAQKFPIVETTTVKTDTIYQEILLSGDSVECPPATLPKKVKCPDVRFKEKVITETVVKVQENTAKITACELELTQAKEQLLQEKQAHLKTLNHLTKVRYQYYGLVLLILLAVAYKLFKPRF